MTSSSKQVEAYPLSWPAGWPRWSKSRPRAFQFKMSDGAMVEHLYGELERLGARNVVVSSNMRMRLDGKPLSEQRMTDDPGVAVYFELKGHQQCIPCDKWDRPLDNLHATGLAIAAIRGFERWGTGQMVDAAFAGFTAIPATATAGTPPARPWWEVLEVSPTASPEVISAAYKAKRRSAHPDAGGTDAAFHEVERAHAEAQE